jgi:hypothetical protein
MGGQTIEYDVCVGVSVGGYASGCGSEVADAVFPVEIYFPVKESSCTCLVLLISSRLNTIKPIRGIM